MATEKKYELTDETIEIGDSVLHRIRAVRDFTLKDGTKIKKGELGGWVEEERNLSHDGNCWVGDNAKVFGDAQVCFNALVCDYAVVHSDAVVIDSAMVFGDAWVFGENQICDNAKVYDHATLCGAVRISGNARVCGDAHLHNNANICDGAYIRSNHDYCVVQGFGSMHRTTTFFNTSREDGKCDVSVKCGCFEGTLAEFEAKVKETHGDNKYAKEHLAILRGVKIHFGLET